MTRLMLSAAAAALLAACSPQAEEEAADTGADETGTMQEAAPAEGEAATEETAMAEADADAIGALLAGAQLVDILEHERREADRARDEFRNPMETIAFFGLQPDMTVAEALPGGGWYTRVILPYVAAEGRYVALNYQEAVFERLYGERWTEETQAQIRAWPETAPETLAAHGPATTEAIDAYMLDAIPDEENGEADAVLFIRALHHRFARVSEAVRRDRRLRAGRFRAGGNQRDQRQPGRHRRLGAGRVGSASEQCRRHRGRGRRPGPLDRGERPHDAAVQEAGVT